VEHRQLDATLDEPDAGSHGALMIHEKAVADGSGLFYDRRIITSKLEQARGDASTRSPLAPEDGKSTTKSRRTLLAMKRGLLIHMVLGCLGNLSMPAVSCEIISSGLSPVGGKATTE